MSCDNHQHKHKKEHTCHGHSMGKKGIILPCLLLLLKQEPAHGYELMEKLGSFSFLPELPDPGVIYRHLRSLEYDSMVKSQLEASSGGPARKIYSLTSEGERYLQIWVDSIEKRKTALEDFLKTFREI